jgi:histidinol dehydrogenase
LNQAKMQVFGVVSLKMSVAPSSVALLATELA